MNITKSEKFLKRKYLWFIIEIFIIYDEFFFKFSKKLCINNILNLRLDKISNQNKMLLIYAFMFFYQILLSLQSPNNQLKWMFDNYTFPVYISSKINENIDAG